jgi:metal-responsive CopG/Arc/MetJ family transcriptional regulator
MVVKINVSIPKDVLEELDKAASVAKASRSAFLTEAVKHYIEEKEALRQLELRRKAAKTIDRIREKAPAWDATSELLKWREKH